MSDPNEYTMLLASLPHHRALFGATRPPLNRVKLESRLRVLTPEHRQTLDLVVSTLLWLSLPLGMQDAAIVARDKAAMAALENETLRRLVLDRLEMRTCVAALRRRHAGQSSPPATRDWGYGRWVGHIMRHWSEPGFRLEGVFPWLREADRLMRAGDSLGLERLLLEALWKNLGRYAAEHEFDFEAVVIYVLRWSVIDRWTRYDGEAASRRFGALVDSALGEHAALFEGGSA